MTRPNNPRFNYEKVSRYQLGDEDRETLLSEARECAFNWCTKDAWPMGVVMSCLWHEGRMWLTSASHRHRVRAIRRNPRVSVVVSGLGTSIGPGSACTIKGTCTIHADEPTRAWFFRAVAEHAFGAGTPRAEQLVEDLSTEHRVVLEVVPEKFISYDDRKNQADRAGEIRDDELAPYGEADARFIRRTEARGVRRSRTRPWFEDDSPRDRNSAAGRSLASASRGQSSATRIRAVSGSQPEPLRIEPGQSPSRQNRSHCPWLSIRSTRQGVSSVPRLAQRSPGPARTWPRSGPDGPCPGATPARVAGARASRRRPR